MLSSFSFLFFLFRFLLNTIVHTDISRHFQILPKVTIIVYKELIWLSAYLELSGFIWIELVKNLDYVRVENRIAELVIE